MKNDNENRARLEKSYIDNAERLRFALNAANDGLWDWNLEEGTIFFSPRWKQILGDLGNEIADSYEEWISRIHPDDVEIFKEAMQQHLTGITSYLKIEYRMRHKNGTYIWIYTQGRLFRNELGEAVRMTGTNLDITDKKQLENEAKQAVEDKERSMQALINVIRQVVGIDIALNSETIDAFLHKISNFDNAMYETVQLENGENLTPRQVEVLKLLSEGFSNKQIAYELSISDATVKMHITAILRAFESNNRTEAAAKARKLGVV